MKNKLLFLLFLLLFAIHSPKIQAFNIGQTTIVSYSYSYVGSDGITRCHDALLYLKQYNIYIQLSGSAFYEYTGKIFMGKSGEMEVYSDPFEGYINTISIFFDKTPYNGIQIKENNTNISYTLPYWEDGISNTWVINKNIATLNYTNAIFTTNITTGGVDINDITAETFITPHVTIDNVTYALLYGKQRTWTVTNIASNRTDCYIKDFIPYNGQNYPVESIEKQACRNNTILTKLYIPNTIKKISSAAFEGCTQLDSVCIDDMQSWCTINFEDLYSNPLYNGGNLYLDSTIVTNLTFDESIASISNYAFAGCSSIDTITFTSQIQTIGEGAFQNCNNLRTVYNTASIPININENTFSNSTYQGELLVPKESLSLYRSKAGWNKFRKISALEGPDCDFEVDGIYYNIVDLVNRTCQVTFDNPYYYSYFQDTIIVPETVAYKGREFRVIGISPNAFNGAINLKVLSLPSSIETIGENAFAGCTSLQELTLPNSIQQNDADYISLPLISVTYIGEAQTIPNWLMGNNSLQNCIFDCPNAIQIADYAFYSCTSLRTIELPHTIQQIGDYAFYGCTSLRTIELPHTIQQIGYYAFYGCTNMHNFKIPKSLTVMGGSAFASCTALQTIRFTSPLHTLPSYAFAGCTALASIDFGNNVKVISEGAFMNCTSLNDLTITASIDSIGDNVFYGCNNITKLTINDSSNTIKLGQNIQSGSSTGLFSSCSLREVYIGRDVVGKTPFKTNKAIEVLHIGHLVTVFPDENLSQLSQLNTLVLGNRLTTIPSFNTCSNLKSLTIGARLESIPSFSKCLALQEITTFAPQPPVVESDFANKVYIDCDLHVPKGSLSYYQTADMWQNFFSIVEAEPIVATSLTFEQSQIITYIGEEFKLQINVLPFDANEFMLWSTSDSTVVQVDAFGNAKALAEGEVIITAYAVDGSNLKAECTIQVQPIKLVTDIQLPDQYLSLKLGEEHQLTATVLPADASYKNLLWQTSDSSVVMVTQEGLIQTIGIGSCLVSAKAMDQSNIMASCQVTVEPIYVSQIALVYDTLNIIEGDFIQLSVAIEPSNASIKKVRWDVSDKKLASVGSTGVLIGLSAGNVVVRAYTTDGSKLYAEQEFTILPRVSSTISAELKTNNQISLTWRVDDYVKDVKDYNIYVSTDDEPFILWLPNTTQTSATFQGKSGMTYQFVVTARSNAGYVEKYDENTCVNITIN